MKYFFTRIKGKRYTIIHYVALVVIMLFFIALIGLVQHTLKLDACHNFSNVPKFRNRTYICLLIGLLLYLTKTVCGYLGAMYLIIREYMWFRRWHHWFDFDCLEHMTEEYMARGNRRFEFAVQTGKIACIVAIAMFVLALAVIIIRFRKELIDTRIKGKWFTIIHYVFFVVILYFSVLSYRLIQHAMQYNGDHHLIDAETMRKELYLFLLISLIVYLTKTLWGYAAAMFVVAYEYNYLVKRESWFDYGCSSCMTEEYATEGIKRLDLALQTGKIASIVTIVMFILAIVVVVIHSINEVKKRKLELQGSALANPKTGREEGNN